MPNHCENDLWISGPDADVAAVLALIGADQTPPRFDFNALIPYPDPYASMDAEHRAIEEAGKAAGLAAIGAWPERGDPEFEEKWRAYRIAMSEATTPLMDAYKAKWGTGSDGFNSGGIEWRQRVWGTKWGAYDVARRDYDGCACVTYRTAWAPSQSIIVALAKHFPQVTFTLEYFEWGMGFAGGFTCYAEDDWYEDKPYEAGAVSCEWHIEGYKGKRGG